MINRLVLLLVLLVMPVRCASAGVVVSDVLPSLAVSPSNIGGFSTPIAYYNGNIYTINVEDPAYQKNGINLSTTIRKGTKRGTRYSWEAFVIDKRTLDDPYHTIGSIAVDKAGYVHAAYNMHNMPWQYSISNRPEDIKSFTFHGQQITDRDIQLIKYENKANFKSLGTGYIPGTQVTYPSFFKDRNDELYVTYRFGLKPKRPWNEIIFSGGIARYNTDTRQWQPLGASVGLSPADADAEPSQQRSVPVFCSAPGWWANHIRLWFDNANNMHVSWSWSDYEQVQLGRDPEPTIAYAFSRDGVNFTTSNAKPYHLPISFEASDLVTGRGFTGTPAITTDDNQLPIVLVSPPGKPYHYIIRNHKSEWSQPIPSPYGAQTIMYDDNGTAWAFATGPVILTTRTPQDVNSWKLVYKETNGWAYPKVIFADGENAFYVHLTRMRNWAPAPNRYSSTMGDCAVRIIRVGM